MCLTRKSYNPNMKEKKIELNMWGEACEFTKEPISQIELVFVLFLNKG